MILDTPSASSNRVQHKTVQPKTGRNIVSTVNGDYAHLVIPDSFRGRPHPYLIRESDFNDTSTHTR